MINFNNIFSLVIFGIILVAVIYNGMFFIYFMYILILINFIWSIYKLSQDSIRLRDFKLESFNKPGINGASSLMWLVLSILGFIYFYNNYGF